MFIDPGQGDKTYALFQARKLLWGRPPEYDEAEELMERVMWLLGVWSATLIAVAATALWFAGALVAAAAVATVTVAVVGAFLVWWRKRAISTAG